MSARRIATKRYSLLTPHERFLLALTASARKDDIELQRLRHPSGRLTDARGDAEYIARLRACQQIVLGWAQFWEEAYRAWLVFCVARADVRDHLAAEGASASKLAGSVLATYTGLAQFCHGIGCEPMVVLSAFWLPLAERVGEFLNQDPFNLLDGGGQDALGQRVLDRAAQLELMLCEAWPFTYTSRPPAKPAQATKTR